MIYILFVALALVATAVMIVTSARRGVMCIGEKFNLYRANEDAQIVPYTGFLLILNIIVCFVAALTVQISLYKNTDIVSFVKLFGLYIIIISAAVIDSKLRIIPNKLIFSGLIFRVAIYIYEFASKEEMKDILKNDLIGFVIGFVFLALVSFVTKGSLGFGDVKLFGIIGITAGSFGTYSTLLISLIASLIVSLVFITIKKMDRKSAFPFGPCIALGYIVSILLTSY